MKIKRLLSVLLSLCILCSLFVFSGSAEEAEDYSIKILSVPELVIGNAISDVTLPVPSDAKYTVTGKWVEISCLTSGDFVAHGEASGVFEEGKKYALRFYVEAAPDWIGWNYANEFGFVWTDFMLGDEFLDSGRVFSVVDGFEDYTSYYTYLLGETASEVNLEGIPSFKEGDTASVDSIKISEEDKDVASIFSAKWNEINIETYERTEFTGTFEKGKLYELSVMIHAKDGYHFNETSVYLDGKAAESRGYTHYNIDVTVRLDLREEIEKVNILNVQTAKLNETATTKDIKAEDGAKYSIKSAKWIDYSSEYADEFIGKFENKKEYGLEIELEAQDGYRFAEDAKIYFDGVLANEEDVWFSYFSDEECTVKYRANFYELIETIEFTNSEVREIGKAPAADAIKAPEGANYDFVPMVLVVPENDDTEVEVPTVYEEGKAYVTVIQVQVKEGYKFDDEKTIAKVNGKELSKTEYHIMGDEAIVYADYVYFGKKAINDISFDIVPLPDKTPKDIKAQLPAGANYSVEKIEWYDDETNELLEDTDKFEKGKKYYFYIIVKIEDGYYLASNAKITLNGSDFYGFEDANANVFIYNEFGATVKSEVPVPATGDSSNIPLYAVITLLSLSALVVLRKKQTA